MRAFLTALRFLTILPIPGARGQPAVNLGSATAWYPAAGLVIGCLLAGLDWGLGWLWPASVSSALVLAAWVALTGALHLDGFTDCCDGVLAAVPPARRLEILRDVHAGAYGTAGAVLLLLGKYTALASLTGSTRWLALLLVPVMARWVMAAAVVTFPYARPGPGLGRLARAGAGPGQLALATVTAALVVVLTALLGLGVAAPVAQVAVALLALLEAWWIQRRLGGLTGDAYGALCELAELGGLLTLVAARTHGLLP